MSSRIDMVFKIQVHVRKKVGKGYKNVWEDIHPVGGRPYAYPTKPEAFRKLKALYPDETRFNDFSKFKVVEI